MVFGAKAKLTLVEGKADGKTLLAVAHSTTRGTKRAVDDAIFQSGANNMSSVHKDFAEYGVAFDLAAIDRPLSEDEIYGLVKRAAETTGDENAIRSVRQIIG